jgi:hypothetical protein
MTSFRAIFGALGRVFRKWLAGEGAASIRDEPPRADGRRREKLFPMF